MGQPSESHGTVPGARVSDGSSAPGVETPSQPDVETPSGKDAAYENFPVGSFLLPARLRPHIARFYAFARAIDDIADNPDLTPEEKVRRLNGFESAILGGMTGDAAYATAHHMRDSLAETDITPRHCQDLIDAFRQDAVKNRTDDWDDLMHYCIRSAAPVGRCCGVEKLTSRGRSLKSSGKTVQPPLMLCRNPGCGKSVRSIA